MTDTKDLEIERDALQARVAELEGRISRVREALVGDWRHALRCEFPDSYAAILTLIESK